MCDHCLIISFKKTFFAFQKVNNNHLSRPVPFNYRFTKIILLIIALSVMLTHLLLTIAYSCICFSVIRNDDDRMRRQCDLETLGCAA